MSTEAVEGDDLWRLLLDEDANVRKRLAKVTL